MSAVPNNFLEAVTFKMKPKDEKGLARPGCWYRQECLDREHLMYRESLRWGETPCAGETERSAGRSAVSGRGRRNGGRRGWSFRSLMWVVLEQGCSPGGKGRS